MRRSLASLAAPFLALALTLPAAAAVKTYQVTGDVVKVTDKVNVVQKSADEKWEIERSSDTKVTGDLKVGSRVTIIYTMEASSVEVKK